LQIDDADRLKRPAFPPIEVGRLHVEQLPTGVRSAADAEPADSVTAR
jgi:hypothetical protein